MGNKSQRSTNLTTFHKLKSDVDYLNTCTKTDPHKPYSLRYAVLIANKVKSKALLPLTWKFHKNVMIQVSNGETTAHLDPKAFYTLYSILYDIENELASTTIATENSDNSGETKKDETQDATENNGNTEETKKDEAQPPAQAPRQPSYDDNECSLCMDARVDCVTSCAHAFCADCLSDWKKQHSDKEPTCPLCRAPLARETSDDRLWVLEETADTSSKSVVEFMTDRILKLLAKHQITTTVIPTNKSTTSNTV